MASATYRSNSNEATTLYVSLTEVARSGTNVTIQVDYTVHTGPSTSLGASEANQRSLIIRHSNGTDLSIANIKNASTTWNANSNYSGSWQFTFNCGTYSANTQSMTPSTTATGTQSCIWTTYVSQLDVAVSEYWSASTAPTNLSHTLYPGSFENTLTFTWNRGSNGTNNAITDQHLYYTIDNVAKNGIAVGASATSYALNTSQVGRGQVIRFHVYSISAHNLPLSAWSPYFTKNRTPYAPKIGSASKNTVLPGGALTVSFVGNGDADGNLVGYEIATDEVSDGIVASNITSSPASINTTGWSQGIQRRFKVRAVDSFGIRSAWSGYTQTVSFNAEPDIPIVRYPIHGSTVYHQKPHILIQMGDAPSDGPENVLCASANSDTFRTTASNGGDFSCGTQVNVPAGDKVVYRPSANIGVGSKVLRAKAFDGYLYSLDHMITVTVVTPSFTDSTLTPGVTLIKAVHVSELQPMINNLRHAYGLSNYTFSSCVAGTSLISNTDFILEMQSALQGVINRINGWDSSNTTFNVSVSWVNISVTGGVDATKLRQAIEQIRTVIASI